MRRERLAITSPSDRTAISRVPPADRADEAGERLGDRQPGPDAGGHGMFVEKDLAGACPFRKLVITARDSTGVSPEGDGDRDLGAEAQSGPPISAESI